MTSVPIFQRFAVDGYGLYPGTPKNPGLDTELQGGLTLVLGANGLGKTTLVTMLYRMCAGPFELRASGGDELGGRNLDAVQLTSQAKRTFANRVVDGASTASATVDMRLGPADLTVTRRLSDMALTAFSQDGTDLEPKESVFQSTIRETAGVPTYGDWILLLRTLVFYFEDRRALVWDPSAQRQVIRLLFLPTTRAAEWMQMEREVLELDSRMRNLQAAVTREEAVLGSKQKALTGAADVRAELSSLARLQEIDEPRLAALNERVAQVDFERQSARLSALTAERDHESAFRNLERLQLSEIASAFPSADETSRYLLGQLISDGECLTCGTAAPGAVAELKIRAASNRCVICGSDLPPSSTPSVSKRALSKAGTALEIATERVRVATDVRQEAEGAYDALVEELQQLGTAVAERRVRIAALVRRLPPEEAEVHQQRDELVGLRGRVDVMKVDLASKRQDFSEFIDAVNRDIVARADAVKSTFQGFASGFLLEPTELVWAPHLDTVGQSGRQVAYPAFELSMGGTNFPSPVRRAEPDEVSESQREFIDLAFRMTLMEVATSEGAGSLVIDAPESSLDAVFVRRAAGVLMRFADDEGENRLVVTSNLIEGDLIPELLRGAHIKSSRDPRVVDLLSIAAPTVATSRLHKEYTDVRRGLFQKANRAEK